MIERILKHMNIYREMKNAAIPLNLRGEKRAYEYTKSRKKSSKKPT